LGQPSKPVIKNSGSAPADYHHPPLNFLHPPEKNMKIRPCFRRFQTVFGSQKGFEICKILQKPRHNIFADLQEMFVSLSSFVKQQQILNLTNQCSLFMTVCHIF
jgi:hypothetical protein